MNIIELKSELSKWEEMIPTNNMGKLARQTKIDNLKKQIESMEKHSEYFSNDPNNDTDVYNENSIINELMDMVVKHDYSHMFSDDNRASVSGERSETKIKNLIHILVSMNRVDAERLLEDCLYERDEQYLDGLTHKTIRSWFTPYVENVNNIFVKPKFEFE